MPLLGQAGRPQKKQFSTRILRLGPTGVVVGCRGVCRVCTTTTGVDADLDVPEKKLTAFAGGKEVGEGPYRGYSAESIAARVRVEKARVDALGLVELRSFVHATAATAATTAATTASL